MVCIKLIAKTQMKKTVNNIYGDYENDYIRYDDFVTPSHFIGRKNDNIMLR